MSAQENVQPGPAYGETYPAGVKRAEPGARLCTIACGLAFAAAAIWFLGAGYRLFFHSQAFTPNIATNLKHLNWWVCIPLLVAAALLLARRSNALIEIGFLIGTSVLLYQTAFQLGFIVIEHLDTSYYSAPIGLNLVSAALSIAAFGFVTGAVIQAKPTLSMPTIGVAVVACIAAAASTLNLVLATWGAHFWSFDLFFLDTAPVWYQLLVTAFAVVIVVSIGIGCMLGGRAAASVAIVGATYFGFLSIQTLFRDNSHLAAGFFFGSLACAAFIATAIIGWSEGKRDEQPELVDPSLLAR